MEMPRGYDSRTLVENSSTFLPSLLARSCVKNTIPKYHRSDSVTKEGEGIIKKWIHTEENKSFFGTRKVINYCVKRKDNQLICDA